MRSALDLAEQAYKNNEVPVGAVIVKDGKIISTGANNREETGDATGHAETLAIRRACETIGSWHLDGCETIGSWHLDGCELYVTLEPCPMCMGAIINSRIKRIVFGTKDAKAGACGSVINLNNYPFNHKPEISSGIMEEECSSILSDFFSNKR